MTGLPQRSATALAPVRGSLLTAAQKEAADIRRDASEQALALLHTARREATARSGAALRSARVRRQGHETVLARQNALRLELRRQVRESAAALRTDPRYPPLLTRLTEQSHALLGPDATVAESPDGGVVAEAGSRRLDLSLPTLATRTLESMTQEVRQLWTR